MSKKKQLQIKDSQIKKNRRWHILRLLRLNNRTKQELIDKLRLYRKSIYPRKINWIAEGL